MKKQQIINKLNRKLAELSINKGISIEKLEDYAVLLLDAEIGITEDNLIQKLNQAILTKMFGYDLDLTFEIFIKNEKRILEK